MALTAPAFAIQAKVSDGVLTWENGEEVALFGVNYSVPFAFTYRSIAQVGADHKQAILMDIDHFERMGELLITDRHANSFLPPTTKSN